MQCIRPRDVGFQNDGKTIAWSQKQASKEFAFFQLPCGKCLNCRLEYARQWAVRCVHEAKMHSENSFITLTYDDKHLGDNVLDYRDFQLFMKKLRFAYPNREIGYFVTGEYGEKTKRKHWHAIIFDWQPPDQKYEFTTDRGDKVYSSAVLDSLWQKGRTRTGAVTFESAGYCARYAAKGLVHGHDSMQEHRPISKKSSKHAIGKRWLERYHDDIFNYGDLIVDGRPCGSIPRYYLKWLQKHQPQKWERYVTIIQAERAKHASDRAKNDQLTRPFSNSANEAKRIITLNNVKNRLFKFLKL